MRRLIVYSLFSPLEHGKIDDAEECELFRFEKLMSVVILLGGEQTQLAARLVDGLLRTMALRPAGPRGQQQQIFFGRAGALANFGHGFRKITFQTLLIAEHPQSALGPEGFQLIALLAAQSAGFWNADSHQWQAIRGKIRNQILDRNHRWD